MKIGISMDVVVLNRVNLNWPQKHSHDVFLLTIPTPMRGLIWPVPF